MGAGPRCSCSTRSASSRRFGVRSRPLAVGAILRAEFDVQQAQEVIDLGERRDGALAAAAAGALLDRDRRRNAENRVHVRSRRRLHELARVGVEGFEIAALTLVEQDVKGERRFARTRDAGDDREPIARYLDVDVLQVVLARLVYDDASWPRRGRRGTRARRTRQIYRGSARGASPTPAGDPCRRLCAPLP